jgi:hypothetical protein
LETEKTVTSLLSKNEGLMDVAETNVVIGNKGYVLTFDAKARVLSLNEAESVTTEYINTLKKKKNEAVLKTLSMDQIDNCINTCTIDDLKIKLSAVKEDPTKENVIALEKVVYGDAFDAKKHVGELSKALIEAAFAKSRAKK